MDPLETLKDAGKKLVGHVDLDPDTIRPAAERLQAKYEEEDYSTEWYSTTANGVTYDISIHEADATRLGEKVRLKLSDQTDRPLAVTVSEKGETYERPYTLFIPPTTVDRTTQIIGAEIVRIHNNREQLRNDEG